MMKSKIFIIFSGKGDTLKVLLGKGKDGPFAGKYHLPEVLKPSEDSNINIETALPFGLDLFKKSLFKLSTRNFKDRDPRGEVEALPEFYYISDAGQLSFDDGIFINMPINIVSDLPFDHGAILCEALACCWEGFPHYQESTKDILLPEKFAPIPKESESLTFYGGSFNPVHQGHKECVRQNPEANIVIMPDFNPLKERSKKVCFFEYYIKIKREFALSSKYVYPGFCGLEQSNPTIDWISKVKFNKINMIIGDDNFLNLDKWKNPEGVLKILSTLYVVPRLSKGQDLQDHAEKIKQTYSNLDIKIMNDHKFQDLSSTKIRSSRE